MNEVDFFRLPMREIPWTKEDNGHRPCPLCGKAWLPWRGSRLPCHSRCLFTEAGVAEIVRCFRHTMLTINGMAKKLGVTRSIIERALVRGGVPR